MPTAKYDTYKVIYEWMNIEKKELGFFFIVLFLFFLHI